MTNTFSGFPKEGMDFLGQLKKNNSREWFQPRKSVFDDKVKSPMAELVSLLNNDLAGFAPDHINDPAKAIYRIYRDTRFSADKTPYKTHIAAAFPHRVLAKHAGAGFYFSVAPDEIEVAGGLYMPGPEELLAVRSHIAEHHKELDTLIAPKSLRKAVGDLQGNQLTRIPKGFPADHPVAGELRRKQWYFYITLDGELSTSRTLHREVRDRFRLMVPLVAFLNAPLLVRKRNNAVSL
jgi:uncharacterized protein (TIGR02453 family)